jgi:hypothetical protein
MDVEIKSINFDRKRATEHAAMLRKQGYSGVHIDRRTVSARRASVQVWVVTFHKR